MRHDFLDKYSRINSPIHRLPSMAKLWISFSLVVAIISIPLRFFFLFPFIGGVLLGALLLSRIPIPFIFSRLLILEFFTVGIAMLSLLRPNGTMLFIALMTRSTLCLFTVILLSNSTPFAELLEALKRLKFPPLILTILALMYRYIFVLIDEMERMTRARESRSFSVNRRSRWTLLASLIGQLFIRSTERAERIYAAMSARGWK
jgi:cobalt/nickel transport system permease protein